ncbi:MAG: hypothetical protein U9Q67_04860 [Patescibacteria group bacterium]|nr:hypothetical protein [Patescibacteria group bacterium]
MLIKRIEKGFVSWLKEHWSNLFLGAGPLVFYILRYLQNAFPQRVFVFGFFTRLFWENSVFKGDYWINGLYNGTSLASALVSPLTYFVFLPTKLLNVELYSVFVFSAVTAGTLFLVRKILSRLTRSRSITFVGTFAFFVFPLFYTVTNKYGRIDIVLAVLFVLLFINLLLDYRNVKRSWLKVTLVCLGILFSNLAVFQVFILLLLPLFIFGLFRTSNDSDLYKAVPKMVLLFSLGSIGLWLPLLIESKWLYFPSPDLAQNLVSDFGVSSIFEFVNRNGQLGSALESSGVQITSSGIYFIGFAFVPAIAIILWLWERVVHRRFAISAIVASVFGVFLSMTMTFVDVSYVRQISMVFSEVWGLVIGLAALVLVLLVVIQKYYTRLNRPVAVVSYLVIAIIFICCLPPVFMLFPFVVLLLIMPLGLSVLLVIALEVVRQMFVVPRDFIVLTVIVFGFVLWDFSPYLGFEIMDNKSELMNIESLAEQLEIEPESTVLLLDVMDSLGSKIAQDKEMRILSGYWEIFPSSETGKYYFEHIYGTLLNNFRLNKDKALLEQGLYDFNVHYLLDSLQIKPNIEDTEFIPLETFSIAESNEDFALVNTGSTSTYVSSEPRFVIEPLAQVTDFSNEDMTNLAAQRSRQTGSITADYASLALEFTECDDGVIAVSTEMCELDIEDAVADIENLTINTNEVEFNLASSTGVIVLKETYHPYWRARIDEYELKTMRTNITNLGFYAGDKTGEVKINYSVPLIYVVTFWLSCISMLLSSIMVAGFNEKK